jgi:hypothetical protein
MLLAQLAHQLTISRYHQLIIISHHSQRIPYSVFASQKLIGVPRYLSEGAASHRFSLTTFYGEDAGHVAELQPGPITLSNSRLFDTHSVTTLARGLSSCQTDRDTIHILSHSALGGPGVPGQSRKLP